MKIAVFTETAPPNVNGVVRRLDHTIPLLERAGDEVLLFAPAGGPNRWHGSEVVHAPSIPLPMYPEVAVGMPRPALRSRLAKFAPDVVHAVNPAILGAGGLLYARSLGIPVVASFHTHLPRYLRHYGLGLFEPLAWDLLRSLHNQAAINLCISDPIADELRGRGLDRVEVGWRGGVDTSLFHPERNSRSMRVALSGGNPDLPLIIAVGRLSAEKGLDIFAPMLDKLPGVRLAFIGDGPYRAELERRLKDHDVCFAGYLTGDQLASAVASADALVFPSQTDTLGLVLLEAMAAGTPVVAANCGGAPDLVRDAFNGMLFAPGDADSAAAAVRRLLADDIARELIRVAARRQAERWTWAAATDDLRTWYGRAVELQAMAKAA
jgi:glycosyltransferase involved in cell wall biosynthesis